METITIADIKELLQNGEFDRINEYVSSLQPFDVSEIIEALSHAEQLTFVSILPVEAAAEALEYLDPEIQYRILHHLDEKVAIPLLKQMSSDVVVDLLLSIHPLQAEALKNWLPDEYRKRIDHLMTFPENTAGSLVTVDYIAVRKGWSVQQTIAHIRKVGRDAEIISYIYVVDAHGILQGVVSLRDLIMADPDTRLEKLVNPDVISVKADTDQEEAAQILSQYAFLALPVIDDTGRLIGIISVDDLFEVAQDEATEDIQKLGGSEPLPETYFKTPIKVIYQKRVGWLLILFLAEAYTGTVLRHFEDILTQMVALTFFIPLLIGTGGNTGSQTVTTLVRSLALGEVSFSDIFRVIGRELAVGTLLGLTLSVATFVRAHLLGVGVQLGPVVALAALFIVIWASIVAAILPLTLHKLRVDPAVVSGPFITTIVDGTGLFMYFTIARILLNIA